MTQATILHIHTQPSLQELEGHASQELCNMETWAFHLMDTDI